VKLYVETIFQIHIHLVSSSMIFTVHVNYAVVVYIFILLKTGSFILHTVINGFISLKT